MTAMEKAEVVKVFDCPVCKSIAGSFCKTSFGTERQSLHLERYQLGVLETKAYNGRLRAADDHPLYGGGKKPAGPPPLIDIDTIVTYSRSVIGRIDSKPKKAPYLKYQEPVSRVCNCNHAPGRRHAGDCPAKPVGSGIVTRMVPRDQGDTTSLTTLTRTR